MSKNEKRVPELRFKGFIDDWEQRELKRITKKATEKNKNNFYSETLTNSAEFGIITQRDFFEKDISNKKNLSSYFIVHPDYFVYNPRISSFAPVGPIKRNKLGRTGVMSPLYYIFYTHDIDKTYLEHYFSGDKWHKFMKLHGDSGVRSDRFSMKDSIFQKMPIPIPLDKEQIKLGIFFNVLDKTVALHQQKLDKLEQLKKGFMEIMFTQKEEDMPRLRFANFNKEWEKRNLDSMVERVKSYPLSRNVETNEYTGYKYIHYGDIHTKVADKINKTSNLPNIMPGRYVTLKKGDLILADASEDY